MRYQSKYCSKTQINISAWILALTAITVENEKKNQLTIQNKSDIKSQENKEKTTNSVNAA